MDFIKINETPLPSPYCYEISKKDVDNGEKSVSETGILHRSIIRSGVYSLELSWRVSETELKIILDAISGDSFATVFFDPASDKEKSRIMYAKDSSFSCIGFDGGESWWNLSVCLLEF